MPGSLLTPSQCQRLKEHKYNAEGRSISEFLLQPFWTWTVGKMPVWLAPNAITFAGLLVNVVSSSILLYYCPTATEEPPSWCLLLCTFFLFVYQTLDAIDGKQAKKLNQSSPLGEVFDHGCDAVSCLVVSLSLTSAVKLGSFPGYYFLMNLNSLLIFYFAHWDSYVIGRLKFGKFDVTEIQLMCCTTFVLVACFGTGFLSYQIMELPYFGKVVLWQIGFYFILTASVCRYISQFFSIMAGGVGKNGSSVAETSVLSPAIPVGLLLLSACYIFKHSNYQVFQKEPNITMLVFGTCFAKLTWKLVIAAMTKYQVDMTDSSMFGPFGLVLINYFSIPVNEYHALLFFAVFECIDFCWYSIRICLEISICLDLNIFTITPKKE